MFNKIDIGIKTFLRNDQLFHAIQGIKDNYPGARMIIVDCGEQDEQKDLIYAELTRAGHITCVMAFDAGFGAMSNAVAQLSTRPYLLIGSDDFEFDKKAAEGLEDLQSILESDKSITIASGRVNKRAYEFFLNIWEEPTGIHIKEIPIIIKPTDPVPWHFDCDLTVNYSLIRMAEFRQSSVCWDYEAKIGNGEHGAFFFDCRMAGLSVVCAPNVNINEQQIRSSERYKKYRNRAQSPERICFDKREIISYTLGNGKVDYRRA